ncbi:hypothetical protein BJY00DRAFT_314067 [Aspergillus carlsbadensis]|nr:hypothetical protein BJY00DRAFT_314067 [Aspergillus carlsbadensis]
MSSPKRQATPPPSLQQSSAAQPPSLLSLLSPNTTWESSPTRPATMLPITHFISIILYALALAEYALVESITNALLLVYDRLSATYPGGSYAYNPTYRYRVIWRTYQ